MPVRCSGRSRSCRTRDRRVRRSSGPRRWPALCGCTRRRCLGCRNEGLRVPQNRRRRRRTGESSIPPSGACKRPGRTNGAKSHSQACSSAPRIDVELRLKLAFPIPNSSKSLGGLEDAGPSASITSTSHRFPMIGLAALLCRTMCRSSSPCPTCDCHISCTSSGARPRAPPVRCAQWSAWSLRWSRVRRRVEPPMATTSTLKST